MSDNTENDNKAQKLVGDLFKKAVTLGAGAYVKAEDTVAKTINSVNLPKDFIKQALDNFLENYTININAEIRFSPKKKEEKSK